MAKKPTPPAKTELDSMSQEDLLALARTQANTITEQAKLIEELNNALEAKGVSTAGSIEFEGKNYKMISPKFNHKQKQVTAETLKGDVALIAELIASNLLIEVK